MDTLEETRRRLSTVRDLHGLVRTVKVLSAVAVRQYQNAVLVQEEYRRVLIEAYQALFRLASVDPWSARSDPGQPRAARRPSAGPDCLIALGADQGLCGPFNEGVRAIVATAPVPAHLLVAGARLRAPLIEADRRPDRTLSMPSSLAGVTPLVRQMVLQVEEWSSLPGDLTVDVVHQTLHEGGEHQPARIRLLPPDSAWLASLARAPWEASGLPVAHLSPSRMLSQLVRQWLFSELYRAVVRSLCAESQARLVAMQGAEKALGDRVVMLELAAQHLRQELVTDELLELMAGYEAVSSTSEASAAGRAEVESSSLWSSAGINR